MSHLGQFLKERKAGLDPDLGATQAIEAWKSAAGRLMTRMQKVLAPYRDELTIETWLPLFQDAGHRYNMPALTMHFLDDQITVQPKKAPIRERNGRVEMSCGLNIVWLLWSGGETWSYKWEYPARAEGPQPLTDEAIEQLIEELLK